MKTTFVPQFLQQPNMCDYKWWRKNQQVYVKVYKNKTKEMIQLKFS